MAREPAEVCAQRRALGSRLSTFRRAMQLTQRELAEALHYERTSIAHIEAGRQPATREFWTHADAILKANDALIAGFDELDRSRRAAAEAAAQRKQSQLTKQAGIWRVAGMAAPLLSGPASTGDVLDATVWSWAHPVAASDVVSEAGGDVLHWLVDHGRLWSAAHANGWRRIGQSDVRRAHEVRDRLKDLDNSLGGGAALPMALGYVRQEIPAMLGGRYDDKTGRALVRAIAELTLDIGWMAYDAGNQPEARRQMLQALHLAQVAGDRLFGGRVAAAMSHQALHLGRVAEAVDLAEAARSGTRQVASPTASAMFSAMQACAFAAEHDQRRSFDALRVAEEAMQRARPDEDLPGWLDFDDGAVAGHAARAMCTLGSPGQAQAFARYAVAHCRPGHRRTLAQREALLANALYQAHDLEQAVAVGEKVLEEAWQLHSDQVRHDVTQLSGLLRASKSRAVWRFVRQAEELARATAPRYSFTTT